MFVNSAHSTNFFLFASSRVTYLLEGLWCVGDFVYYNPKITLQIIKEFSSIFFSGNMNLLSPTSFAKGDSSQEVDEYDSENHLALVPYVKPESPSSSIAVPLPVKIFLSTLSCIPIAQQYFSTLVFQVTVESMKMHYVVRSDADGQIEYKGGSFGINGFFGKIIQVCTQSMSGEVEPLSIEW
ncbi:MAG: hypothetical protein K0T99_01390 [Alphaproteobacteria bacterium]|nr:hypothetical protein [Alphaproteobacteria bacterium]